MKNLVLIATATLTLAACAVKQKVMDAGIVSMTYPNLPAGAKLTEAGPVTGKFCSASSDKGSIGLFDEAVKSAQAQYKIDFITNATFWHDENGCILLEGTGQRLLVSSAATTATADGKPAQLMSKKKTH